MTDDRLVDARPATTPSKLIPFPQQPVATGDATDPEWQLPSPVVRRCGECASFLRLTYEPHRGICRNPRSFAARDEMVTVHEHEVCCREWLPAVRAAFVPARSAIAGDVEAVRTARPNWGPFGVFGRRR